MIVDDEPDMLEACEDVLRKLDIETVTLHFFRQNASESI